mgnify:CR=1 FL=1
MRAILSAAGLIAAACLFGPAPVEAGHGKRGCDAPVAPYAVPYVAPAPVVAAAPTTVQIPERTVTVTIPGQTVALPGAAIAAAPVCPSTFVPATVGVDVYRYAPLASRRARRLNVATPLVVAPPVAAAPRPRLFGGRRVDGLEE